MRILFWSEKFWPLIGGAESFGTHFISDLRERGHEVMVITSKDPPDLPSEATYKNIPIFRLPFQEGLSGRAVEKIIACQRQVSELKRQFQPEIIHINGVSASTFFHLQTHNRDAAPVVARMNQEIFRPEGAPRNTLTHGILMHASWITSVSEAVHNQIGHWVPETRSRSSVIYTGVKKPPLVPTPLPFDSPVIVCLGRLVRAKGFDLALTALAPICERFPKIRIIIGGDGPLRRELEQLAKKLGLEKSVEFVGWVEPSRVNDFLNSATMVLIPSRHEGLPQVACQAAMMGRPIVATGVAGLPEIIEHHQTGLLIEKENVQALTEAVWYLLQHPEASTRMGHMARTKALKQFDWEKCVAAYDHLYKKLVKPFIKSEAQIA